MSVILVHAERTADPDRLRWVVSGGGHPPAGAVLDRVIELGVERVVDVVDAYELTKLSDVEWRSIGDAVRARLTALAAEAGAAIPTVETVGHIIDRAVGETLQAHGGSITVLGVQSDRVVLELSGGCAGCSGASVTVDHTVATALRQAFPTLVDVEIVQPSRPVRWRRAVRRS